ncbi:MAG: bi-domain-containing oxidoreductase, partial [Bacteroidetes bacterium]|nr:bi-domain-containing oxidoreductase [Bacteroidota bacterium]
LDNYKELGYSCAGTVTESAADGFSAGDRVACAGASANHSEFVLVPKNLAVRIPEGVCFDEAAFTTLGSIAMQGVRQADVRVGEKVAVIGLGLLGIITVQILKASGCKVIGLDISSNNFEIAKISGCDETILSDEDAAGKVDTFTNGYGTDAVIITASTKSNAPMEQALAFARRKSPVVVVGAVNMDVPRSPFYEKEVDIRISCSYGPGRYDRDYEDYGIDYPFEYVRWTENRNMQSVLDLLAEKKINFKNLITHYFDINDGLKAYDLITGKTGEKHLAVLISYGAEGSGGLRTEKHKDAAGFKGSEKNVMKRKEDKVVAGFLGAGNFAQSYIIPVLKKQGVRLKTVVTSKPVNASSVKEKFGFEECGTDPEIIFSDKEINTVFIASRHDTHGRFVLRALESGKHVFVEKPLALNQEELDKIAAAYGKSDVNILAGFNRRFSKSFIGIKKFFEGIKEPKVILYRVHAGFIPSSHWIQDPLQGGRIIGEGCHFIDTMQFLTGSHPVSFSASAARTENIKMNSGDNITVTVNFADGSAGTMLYLANGDSSVDKEYCEVFSGGRTAIMNNFRSNVYFSGNKKTESKSDGKKGHAEEIIHFLNAVTGKETLSADFNSIYSATELTFRINEAI